MIVVQPDLFEALVQETHELLREKESLEAQFIDVVVRIGQNLIQMRPHKPYGDFIPWVEEEFKISSDTAYNYMHVAESYGNNSERVRSFPLRVIYALASPSMPKEVREQVESGAIPPTLPAIREAKQEAQAEQHEEGYTETVPFAEVFQPLAPSKPFPDVDAPYPGVVPPLPVTEVHPILNTLTSKSNEWYTPAKYVEAARGLMGGIDLDPASNATANETIRATTYYDIQTNGLTKDWTGRVWLNPPYGRDEAGSNQDIWSNRLIDQFNAGSTTEAVLLVNAAVDTKWFQRLFAYPICFPNHRINFYTSEFSVSGSTHGSALVYLGSQQDRFAEIFSEFGTVVRRW